MNTLSELKWVILDPAFFLLVPIIVKKPSAREPWKWVDNSFPTKSTHAEAHNCFMHNLFQKLSNTSLADELLWRTTFILSGCQCVIAVTKYTPPHKNLDIHQVS